MKDRFFQPWETEDSVMRSVPIARLRKLIKEAKDRGDDTTELEMVLKKLQTNESSNPSILKSPAPKGSEQIFATGATPRDGDFDGVAVRDVE